MLVWLCCDCWMLDRLEMGCCAPGVALLLPLADCCYCCRGRWRSEDSCRLPVCCSLFRSPSISSFISFNELSCMELANPLFWLSLISMKASFEISLSLTSSTIMISFDCREPRDCASLFGDDFSRSLPLLPLSGFDMLAWETVDRS